MSDADSYETDTSAIDLSFLTLGKGWVPLDFVISVKCLDPEGQVAYREIYTKTLHPIEALGMLETASDSMRARIMRGARRT